MQTRPATPYAHCPKCGHAPLPADQSLPATCPACGLVLAKFGSLPRQKSATDDEEAAGAREEEPDDDEGIGHYWQQFRAALRHVPDRVEPATFWVRVALLAAFALWGGRLILLDYRVGEMGMSFLHGPLLVFHEAGHVLFRPFGEFMTIAGGTAGQLLMPAILAGALLLRNRDPYGAAIGLWLFGVSLLDVAPYAFDALQPQLVLLGGQTGEEGGHDWIYLLNATGLLPRAQGIGGFIHKLGAVTIIAAIAWAAWILRRQYARLANPVEDLTST